MTAKCICFLTLGIKERFLVNWFLNKLKIKL